MTAKKIFVYFLIMLLTAYPGSAADVALNRWVLNVTLNDNGLAEVIIQAELQNPGPAALEGFSFVVPVSVTIDTEQSTGTTFGDNGEMKFNIPDVKQQTVSSGTNIIVIFDKPVESGKKWSGRIGYRSEKMVTKDNSGYSLSVPVDAPQAIVSGKNLKTSVPANPDIRAQVFLPKSYEVISVEPAPFRQLFQYGRIVPTWTPEKLHIGDVIRVKASFSSVLDEIVKVDDRAREVSARIKEAKKQGMNVSDAEMHLANAGDYYNNQAFASYSKKEYAVVQKFVGYANDELTLAENSLNASKGTPEPIKTEKSPGFEGLALIFILLISVKAIRKK